MPEDGFKINGKILTMNSNSQSKNMKIGSVDAIKFSLQQSENQRLEIRKFEDVVRLPVSMDVASTICIA